MKNEYKIQEMNQTLREFIPYEISKRLENEGKLKPVSIDSTRNKHARGILEGVILATLAGGLVATDIVTGFKFCKGIPVFAEILGLYSIIDHFNRSYEGLEYAYPVKDELLKSDCDVKQQKYHATYIIEKGYELYKNFRDKIRKK